ncbi:MAG: glycosyltransferase [Methanobrevibacter sp.]|jgi:uncharacterized protein (TIGR00661 family)|nr:glycosyltransferase [Candidatus Methanoflexus mossambicus]
MKLSIIIPTYNEEEYLPILLESIKSQEFTDYEIIIADANSTDKTREIAKSYACKIVKGGMPAVGRNNGAAIAKGEILLFLDSDLKLSKNYLNKILKEFEKENVDIGITLMTPLSKKTRDKVLHNIANSFMIAFEKIKPHGAGCYGIIVKKELHNQFKGFNQNLNFGEDTDYIERIGKVHNFKVLKSSKIGVSVRRLEEEGLKKIVRQYSKSTFNDFMGKRTDASEIEYGFGHGKDLIEEKDIASKIKKLRHSKDNLIDSKPNKTVKQKELKKEIDEIDKIKKIAINSHLTKLNTENNDNNENINLKENKKQYRYKNEVETKTIMKTRDILRIPKKKIFYGVCGEGMGHGIRSGVIIEELLKYYDVWIFSSDRAYKYLNEKFDNVYEIGGFNTVYENNEVKNKKTLLKAAKIAPSNLKEGYEILFKLAMEIHPNIIITDFENYSSMLSKLLNIPLLSVDNIHMITKTHIKYPHKYRKQVLKAKGVIKSYMIRPKKYILTSFFLEDVKNDEKAVIYPPVLRNEIQKLKTSYEDYIFIYQTNTTNTNMIEELKKIDAKFIIYGYDEDKIDDNLTFRAFNEDKIYEDLKASKAVISNGGFTFITEAIYLKKPIYSIPAKGNFEQLLNGLYVEKLNYGVMREDFNLNDFKKFLKNLDKYKKYLNNTKNHDNKAIFKEIRESIEKYSKP